MRKPSMDNAKLVTVASFGEEEMAALIDSEHGHFSALILATMETSAMAAVVVQELGERLVELGMSQEQVEQLITDCRHDDPLMGAVRGHIGDTCIKSAVIQWNCEVAGLTDEPERQPPKPRGRVVLGSGFTMVDIEVEGNE